MYLLHSTLFLYVCPPGGKSTTTKKKLNVLFACLSLSFSLFLRRPAEEPTTWGGYLGKVLMASTTYLPSQVTEMFTQGRAFATVRLPFCGHKNICALAV